MKKFTLVILIVLGFVVSGFGQQTIYDTIIHDNIDRAFIVYVPASYDSITEMPVVFNFHGYTSNSAEQMWYGDFRSIADTANFIIVHPMGTKNGFGTTHWNVGWGGSSTNDLGFIDDLLDTLKQDYAVDSMRIYSTGMSNGGFMSYLLACELSNQIAAVASVTGSIAPGKLTSCNPTHPTPIMQIHGTNDQTVPYTGSSGVGAPIEDVVDYWRNFNSTRFDLEDTLPNINTTDGSEAVHIRHTHGDSCVDVEFYKILNGGHTWPGTAFSSAGTNHDFDASEKIWQFFAQYDLNGRIGNCPEEPDTTSPTGISETNYHMIQIYPNPVLDVLNVSISKGSDQNNEIDSNFKITDGVGRIVSKGFLQPGINQISTASLPRGNYILHFENTVYNFVK